ncbi:MAG: site-specific integrase [Betaproteobacteria bacterium]
MSSFAGIADDLAAFRRFLDEEDIDWTSFPQHKLSRPTYRFSGHLRVAVGAGEVKQTTAKRRMSSVMGFYTWLMEEGALFPDYAPWQSKDRYLQLKNNRGFVFSKKVQVTDIGLKVAKSVDPYAGTINDGGELRPLPLEEQIWLMEALFKSGNTEMTLIHLMGLLTGARIQTILTFQVRHVSEGIDEQDSDEIRLPVGPGTGIDTKDDKSMVLFIPRWFREVLRTYAFSERAKKRRRRATGGDTADQYLFLSIRGAPLYQSKKDSAVFDDSNELHHQKSGQGVRQFKRERVLPYIRKCHSATFKYRFHDTRATYGMNLTDFQLQRVARGEITLHEAREFVRVRMGHESAATTDLYLKYRNNLKMVRKVAQDYNAHLQSLANQALKGIQ